MRNGSMKKIANIIIAVFKGIEYFLSALDWLAFLLILIMALIAVPLHLVLKYTEVGHPFMTTVVLIILLSLILYLIYNFMNKRKNT